MGSKHHSLSVLMFPWLAHGHISPFLELAKKLAQRNIYTYFCSTPVNLCSIKEHFNEKPNPSIQLVELHLPLIPNLPPRYHTTKSLPPHLMPTLKEALDMAQPSFSNLLMVLKPDLIIYDFFQPWVPSAAATENIPSILFLTTGAATSSYIFHFWKKPSVEFPFPDIYLHEHDKHTITNMLRSNTSIMNPYLESNDRTSSIVLIKTFREIEDKYIDYLSFIGGKEFLPVGPLVQEPEGDGKQSKFVEWLSKKDESSAVSVSFGSEYFMSREEIEEIAYGLELSKVNFIWVIRFPDQGYIVRVDEVLPPGFLERVGDKGLVVEGWAPQVEILGHSSIGGFVSHCGWSSVMEGMKFGVPIIAMPMHLDQPLNARLVVELGVGMEVKREKDGDGRRIVRGEVAKVIDVVMMEEEGEDVRRRAKEISENIRKKVEGEIVVVVENLMKLCGKSGHENDHLEEQV